MNNQSHIPFRRPRPQASLYSTIDLENEDDIVCIGTVNTPIAGTSRSKTNVSTPQRSLNKHVHFEDDEIEWIFPSSASNPPPCANNSIDQPRIIDVEELKDEDVDYSLQIENSPCQDIIDVETNYESQLKQNHYDQAKINAVVCYDIEDDLSICSNNSPPMTNSTTISAVIHTEPSPPPSPIKMEIDNHDSEIYDYDTKMRAYFEHDLSLSSIDNDNTTSQLDQTIKKQSMESNEDEVQLVDENSDDDCIVTSYDTSGSCDDFKTLAVVDVDEHVTLKRKRITETVDEIFRRMMPIAVPGAVSLCAPERHCLPQNIRPSKFCYYYFISSHLIVKEVAKNEYYKFKEQMLISKKGNAPPRCDCLTHPLNQNASKLTLLTNPYSLFHTPNCHFSNSSKNNKKRKGPRRLAYQVSFHRIPQKREGKDFKDWNDMIINRRLNASKTSFTDWATEFKEKENLIQHRPFALKEENTDLSTNVDVKNEY